MLIRKPTDNELYVRFCYIKDKGILIDIRLFYPK